MQNSRSTQDLLLRDVVEDDLPLFFDFQLDPEANRMAAFTAKDPTDREAFTIYEVGQAAELHNIAQSMWREPRCGRGWGALR